MCGEYKLKQLSGRTLSFAKAAMLSASLAIGAGIGIAEATPFTETVPNGNGAIPNTYPPVGGTMFVLIGANGNIYYQFVNPSTQFEGFQFTGNPVAFRGNPFQLGPSQTLNCGPTACIDYFGGSIVEGYARLTARDGDACPGNFDFNDVFFEVNGIRVSSFSGLPPNSVERTNRDGTTSIGFEDCFRNQGANETSTSWFDLTGVPGLLNNILTTGSTTPFVFDNDGSTNRGDNFWFFRDGNDATGTPEVAPGINIVKTADQSSYSVPGEVINYSFEVTNIGSVTLNNVSVTDSFISGSVSCPLTTLVSAQSMICTASHTVTQQNIDEDIVFRNVAEVTGNPTEGTLGNVSGEVTIPGPAANNSMTITKSADITSDADVGDTITYTYVVTNTGNITLDDVSVSDAHSGTGTLSAVANEVLSNTSGLSIDTTANDGIIDSLSPGDSATLTATYIVTQGDVDAQSAITNVATGIATPKRGPFTSPTANASVDVIAENRVLTIDKQTTTADFTNAGDSIDYTYEVTNDGNVTITAPVSVSDDVINAAGGNVSCPGLPVGGLAPGASITCTGTYAVTQADVDTGSVTNVATATDGTATSAPDSVTVNGTNAPALGINKRLSSVSPTAYSNVGDTILYEYEVRNTGNVSITAAISVADDVIDGAGGSVSCPALPVGGLAPNNTIVCTASYTVTQSDIDNGSVTNTALATDGNVTSPDDSFTVNAIQTPALTTTKTAQPFAPVDFVVGATANYDYVVQNTGNTTITTPISITDNLIPSVTCDPLPPGGLAPGASLSCTGSYVVTANDIALGSVTNLASATDGTTTSPQTSETVPSGAVPALSLTKTAAPGSTFDSVGDTVNYTFEVTNTGTASFATDITIIDDLLPTSPITCFTSTPSNPDLTPGETITCGGSYPVTQTDLDAGEVFNEATANTIFAGTTPVVSDPATETVNSNTNPSLNVTKQAVPASFSTVGQSLTYTISVQNDGNQTLTNINVSDPLIPTLMCNIPSLAPGITNTSCTGNYIVTQADIDNGQIINTASATGTNPQGGSVSDTGSLTTSGPAAAPAVEVTKSASPAPFGPVGSNITYAFAVRNSGNTSLTNITVTDPIAPAFSCIIPSLLPGAVDNTTCSLIYAVQQSDINAGSITNTASVSAVSSDPSGQTVNDTDQITTNGPTRNPTISIEKIADTSGLSSPVQEGDVISYTFRIENIGNVELTNIDVTDFDAVVSGGPLLSLGPGAVDSTTFTASHVLTQPEINSGSFQNQAQVSADTPPGLPSITDDSDDPADPTSDNDPTVVTIPPQPALRLVKSGILDDGGDGRADAGDVINYTFTVENTGNITLTNVTVSDPAAVVSGGPIATLLPGAIDTITFTATRTITQGDITNGSFINSATVTGGLPGGGTVSDVSDSGNPADGVGQNDPTVVELVQEPSLDLTKVGTLNDGGDGLNAGDTIDYVFTVTNTGNVPINVITIADVVIPVTGGPLNLQPGQTDNTTFSATYTITQADIDNGSVSNTATASGTDPTGATVSDVSDDPGNTTNADPNGDGNPDDPTVLALPQSPLISVLKVGSVDDGGDGSVDVGDTIEYVFTVENTGNVTLTNITVTDLGATVSGGPLGSLAPGVVDTTTFTATRVLTQDDINAGSFTNQATVSGTPPVGPAVTDTSDDPGDATSDDDPTVTTLPATPSIAVEKVGDVSGLSSPPQVGDQITYAFRVENTGNVTLTNITLTDLDAAVSGGPIGSLIPGAVDTTTFTAIRTLTQGDIDAGLFSNQATVSGNPPTGPPVTDTSDDPTDPTSQDDPTVTVIPQAPGIEMVKTATRVDFSLPGDTADFDYVVTNTGNTTITTPISVTDNLIPTVNCPTLPIGGLLPGASITCTGTYTVTQDDLDNGSVTNIATATDGTTTTPITSETIPASQAPALSIVKSSTDTTFANVGDTLTYTFELTNAGNLTLTGTTQVIDDRIGTIDCFTGNFVPGATQSCSAVYTVTQDDLDAGSVTNTAFGQNGSVVSPPDDLTINATQTPSLVVDKSSTDTNFAAVGDTLAYSYLVTNDGNVTITAPVSIADDRIDGQGGSVSCPALPPAGLVPGASITCTGTYTVTQDDLNTGSVTNIASASDGTTTSPTDSVTINATQSPLISVLKVGSVDDGGDGSVDVGDTIEYVFTVENTGNVTLTNITVTDLDAVVSGGPLGSLAPGVVDTTTFTATRVLTQDDINAGSFTNQATVSGTPPVGPAVTDTSDDPGDATSDDDPTVTTLPATPSIAVEKVGDVSGLSSPPQVGDQITYAFRVENTGNVTLTNITLTDLDAAVSGGPIGSLIPGAVDTTTFTAIRTLTQDDIDAGLFSNQATVSGNPPTGPPVTDTSDDPTDPTSQDDPTVTNIPVVPGIDITKQVSSVTQVFPFVFDVEYEIDVTNTGNITLNNISVTDDLASALAPGSVLSTSISLAGFGGTGNANIAYDGVSMFELFQGNNQLTPGNTGTITLTARVDFSAGIPSQGNTAFASSDENPTPEASDDPTVTPGNPGDTNPTPSPLTDTDGDGSPDDTESSTSDRDGDGTPDAQDYDPTGYFYCQETARILPGGLISVTGPLGTQSGVGTSANITIVRDGTDGSYQFHVSAPGTYTLNVTLPATGVASVDRLPGAPLDVTGLLPANPAALGAGEIGATGNLSDGTAAANPFHLEFVIEAGDPPVFNNNIPLQFCGAPEVTASKTVQGTPTILANGSTEVTFRLASENTGTTQVNDITLIDDLDAVFGAGNYSVTDISLVSAPATFGATENTGFDGSANTNLLQSGGVLQPGERVEVDITIEVMPVASGTFTNSVEAGGTSPLDGTALPTSTATAPVGVSAAGDVEQLQVEKIAARPVVRIGEILPYTIRIINPEALDRVNVDIVDFLPAGFTFRPGTAVIDGDPFEPVLSGRRLVFSGQTVPANSSITITFNLAVSAAATAIEFENLAWVEDPLTGERISNIGRSTVRREIEHVFDCGEIIGKVFDDKNRDGYQDEGEPGLPGVRVATVKGELITTDKHGRYHVPCADVPNADIGSNFILKLDTRTLPSGYRVTSENPRVVRLTRGKLAKANFGASISRVVRIDLNGNAFIGSQVEPVRALEQAIPNLIRKLQEEHSVLRLSYQLNGQSKELGRERMRYLSRLIKKRWKRGSGGYDLQIETKVVAGN